MAKVAKPGTLPPAVMQVSGFKAGPTVKRKTPSELREEQLKRTNVEAVVNESPGPSCAGEIDNSLKKASQSRSSRLIGTRINEVYPAKKSRFRMLSGKENPKESVTFEQCNSLKNHSMLSNLVVERRETLCSGDSVPSANISNDDAPKPHLTLKKCSQGTFLSVTELSSGGDKSTGLSTIDMDKALKGLAACDTISSFPKEASEKFANPQQAGNIVSELNVPGQKVPLDFTLKTYIRMVSSSPVNWFHRSMMLGTYNGMPLFKAQSSGLEDQNISNGAVSKSKSDVLSSRALHSWVYPQSVLPASLVSFLMSSAAGGVEVDFFRNRQVAWEDSFRNLYYMLRKNFCDIFYVCTPNFVVMFTAADHAQRTRRPCHAYISQSSRSLRSLLKEQDVSFSMPLCHSKVEQVTTEDLVELSEIEKHNLGQTRRRSSYPDIDNTPQSLLVCDGNENVHGLFEILLNYRSYLNFLITTDVPVLYSPVPFQNAALSAPEVRCMEVKRGNNVGTLTKGPISNDGDLGKTSSGCLSYSIELRDAYIPPWIVSSICAIMGSTCRSFEVSLTTERTSIGLNVALGATNGKADSEAIADGSLGKTSFAFGIPDAVIYPQLSSGQLRSLKYCDGSYMASIASV